MRSNVRQRLGRTAASVTAAVAVAALSATLGAPAASAEDTTSSAASPSADASISANISAENNTLSAEASTPNSDISAKTEVSPQDATPSPSSTSLNGAVDVVDDGDGNGATYKAVIKVVVADGDAENVNVGLSATNASLQASGDGFNCQGGADSTQCAANGALAPGEYYITLTGSVSDPVPNKQVVITATITADGATDQTATGTYVVPADYGAVLQGKVWYDNGDGVFDPSVDQAAGSEVTVVVTADGRESRATVSGGDYSISGIIGKNVTVAFAYDDTAFIPSPQGQGGGTASDANSNGVVQLGAVGADDTLVGRADLGLVENGGGGGDPTETPTGDPTTGNPDPTTTNPSTTDPGTTDPGTTGPGTTNPGTTDPGVTNTTGGLGFTNSNGGNNTTPPPGKLPKTGAAIGGTLAAGAVMVAGGAAISLAARRQEEEDGSEAEAA